MNESRDRDETSAFAKNYDNAFVSRIRYHIEFALPDFEGRKRLWQRMLVSRSARRARRALLGTIGDDAAKRIVVAGYGESRPLPGVDAADPKNPRVEVQFLVDQ
ncbi:hypothetical protein OKW33_007352 [Paraburkholderia atlantica]|uniref:hypothetical protein n=1 Tax=Paraburkholderia atlantica TaxID=2654982 RepID=UPI001D12F08B|nr:hypothetical protein [Paraburkholderia atlantica]